MVDDHVPKGLPGAVRFIISIARTGVVTKNSGRLLETLNVDFPGASSDDSFSGVILAAKPMCERAE